MNPFTAPRPPSAQFAVVEAAIAASLKTRLLMEAAMEVAVILFWTVLCGVCAAVAAGRGRSALSWFLISFFLVGPVIALVIVCCIDRKGESIVAPARAEEQEFYGRYGSRLKSAQY